MYPTKAFHNSHHQTTFSLFLLNNFRSLRKHPDHAGHVKQAEAVQLLHAVPDLSLALWPAHDRRDVARYWPQRDFRSGGTSKYGLQVALHLFPLSSRYENYYIKSHESKQSILFFQRLLGWAWHLSALPDVSRFGPTERASFWSGQRPVW